MFSDQQAMQQLAAQAMLASSSLPGHHYSDASEGAVSVGSRLGDDMGLPLRARHREPGARPPQAGPGAGAGAPQPQPRGDAPDYDGRPSFSPGTAPRRSRASYQSYRSERAYGRRSGASGGRRSVALQGALDGNEDFAEFLEEAGDVDRMDWEVEGQGKPWYRRRLFWRLAALAVSLIFILGGALYLVYGSDKVITAVQIWRLSFFLAGLPVIWWVGDFMTRAVVWGVERSLFRARNALYFAYAVRKPLANVLRAVLALGWWALIMMVAAENQDPAVRDAIRVVLRLWGCVTLFMGANLLKTLLAKLLSTKFNKESHLRKMHDSLAKEYYIHMLLQPRAREGAGAGEGAGGGAEGGGGGGAPKGQQLPEPAEANGGSARVASGGEDDGGKAQGRAGSFAAAVVGLFSGGNRAPKELDTVSEELLEEGALPSTPAAVAVHADGTARGPAAAADVPGADDPGRPLPPPRGLQRTSSATFVPRTRIGSLEMGGAGAPLPRHQSVATARRSSWMRSTGIPLQRTASVRGRPSQRRGSNLAPVLEDSDSARRRGLSAGQLAKMERYIRRNALQVTFRDELSATERREGVTTEGEAKKLAYYLFWNVKAELERPAILLDDVRDFLPGEGEAEEAFAMLDTDGSGSVTLQECIAATLRLYEERCDLAASLKDTKSVVGKLENVIGVAVHIVFVFLYLTVFNVDVVKTYLALSSLVLAFSFVFQNSIRTMYENVVFLFAVHPFDVGDVLQLEAEMYRVDEIDLHYTILIAGSGARTWFPNQKLMASVFSNVSASGERGDAIRVVVDMDTPAGAVEGVRAACEAAAAAAPTELAEGVSVHLREAATPLKVTMVVGFRYTHSGADQGRCSTARTMMHAALCEALTNLGVRYTYPSTREGTPGAPRGGAGRPAPDEAALAPAPAQAPGAAAPPTLDKKDK